MHNTLSHLNMFKLNTGDNINSNDQNNNFSNNSNKPVPLGFDILTQSIYQQTSSEANQINQKPNNNNNSEFMNSFPASSSGTQMNFPHFRFGEVIQKNLDHDQFKRKLAVEPKRFRDSFHGILKVFKMNFFFLVFFALFIS
jgi:hypothetical protein